MLTCLGLDLTGPDWPLSRLRFDQNGDIGEPVAQDPLLPPDLSTRSCFDAVNRDMLAVSRIRDLPKLPGEVDQKLEIYLQGQRYRDTFQRYAQQHGQPTLLCVTHPYRASPIVRRVLPLLVGRPAIGEATPDDDYLALETPLAACLELLASPGFELPATVMLLTGVLTALELTAIRILSRGRELTVELLAFLEINADEPAAPLANQLRQWPANWARGTGPADCRLSFLGLQLEPVATEIAQRLGVRESLLLPPHAAASGAARFAAWRRTGGLIPGTSFAEVNVRHICPRPIGVFGQGGTNNDVGWYYQLVPGGTFVDLASKRCKVTVRDPVADVLVFLEGNSQTPIWLPTDRWTGEGLRVFDTYDLSDPRQKLGTDVAFMEFRLSNHSGSSGGSNEQSIKVEFTAATR